MKIKKLSDAKNGEVGEIYNIDINENSLNERLKNLGILKGEKIKFLKYNYGKNSMLIKVMGINYVIDKSVCENISVKYD